MSQHEDRKLSGTVFNIQKYSVHDGPGIRTLVFLKGCPLRCSWCSNPESHLFQAELGYNENKCLGVEKCQHCLNVCPENAIKASDIKTGDLSKITIDRALCKNCVEICTNACPAKALMPYGWVSTVDEVITTVEQDMMFYARSGGGLTLSGGEPLAQKEFALGLLREAKRRRIKRNIESCGCVDTETMLEAAGLLNSLMFDIKHIDPAMHKQQTGHSNELILKNFEAVVEQYPELPIVVRTPIIPEFNDSEECITQIAEFIKKNIDKAKQKGTPNISYETLAYHRLGTQKYVFLGKQPPLGDLKLDREKFEQLEKIAQKILS